MDKYTSAVIILLTTATAFVAIPLIVNLGDFLTTVFILAGTTCAILGSFVVLFAGNEPIDPYFISLFPVQENLNLCKLTAGSGLTKNACFLPPRITGEPRVMQFNPVSTYNTQMISAKESFTEEKPRGLMTIPTSDPLIQALRKRNALVIPDKADDLSVLINETISEVLDFASNVTTTFEGKRVVITLQEYRFIEGCLYDRSEFPECCSRYPCPVCSLCGTLIAECVNTGVILEQCSASSSKNVTAVFSYY